MARSEYTRLRDIAQKRLGRLISEGLAPAGLAFPKVKELKTESEKWQALASVQDFLASGTKLREIRGTGKTVVPQESGFFVGTKAEVFGLQHKDISYSVLRAKAQKRLKGLQSKDLASKKLYFPTVKELDTPALKEKAREKVIQFLSLSKGIRERSKALERLTEDQLRMIKGAETLGIFLTDEEIPVFVEYMEYRFSQYDDSQHYLFGDYAEDFGKIKRKRGTADILKDFSRFKGAYMKLHEPTEAKGYSAEEFQNMWTNFIG